MITSMFIMTSCNLMGAGSTSDTDAHKPKLVITGITNSSIKPRDKITAKISIANKPKIGTVIVKLDNSNKEVMNVSDENITLTDKDPCKGITLEGVTSCTAAL